MKRILFFAMLILASPNLKATENNFATHIISYETGNEIIDNFFEKELVITFKKEGFLALGLKNGETLFIEPCEVFPKGEFTLKVKNVSEKGDFYHVTVQKMDFVERNQYLDWLRK